MPLGKSVKRGDVIGHTGTTGASTGVHLHFETRRSRSWGTDFDPETILDNCHANSKTASKPTPTVEPKLVEDGVLGRQTWGTLQTMLKAKGFYSGLINGVPGKSTVKGLQKFLNVGGW